MGLNGPQCRLNGPLPLETGLCPTVPNIQLLHQFALITFDHPDHQHGIEGQHGMTPVMLTTDISNATHLVQLEGQTKSFWWPWPAREEQNSTCTPALTCQRLGTRIKKTFDSFSLFVFFVLGKASRSRWSRWFLDDVTWWVPAPGWRQPRMHTCTGKPKHSRRPRSDAVN